MTRTLLSTVRRFVGVAALAIPVLGMLGAQVAPAQAAPNLSITLTSGVDTLAPGDDLTYTAEVVNRGESIDARIVLTPPAYIEVDAADEALEGAVVEGNEVTWTTTLDAAATSTFEIPATVADIPEGELRATALISVYIGDSTTPLVRTASADHIEGVDDEQLVANPILPMVLWVGIGLVVVLVVVAVALVLVQRRRKAAAVAADAEVGPGYRRSETPPVDAD